MSQPVYRIGALAKLSGLSTHAIRVWERRYGAASPHRSPGGARLYSDDDVERFRLIQKLLQAGYATRAIAPLSLSELRGLASASVPESTGSVPSADAAQAAPGERHARATISALLQALTELRMDTAERVLARAGNEFSPRDLLTLVIAPALEEIGRRWQSGELCTASEHAASALLRTRLGALLASQPVGSTPAVVCTTPAGEQHELGALLVAVLVAMRGRRALFLGANLPAEQIAEAARLAKAGAVALSIVGLAPADASRELSRIAKALPPELELVVGGRGASALARLPARVRLLGSLLELEQWLAGETTPVHARAR